MNSLHLQKKEKLFGHLGMKSKYFSTSCLVPFDQQGTRCHPQCPDGHKAQHYWCTSTGTPNLAAGF